MQLCNSFQTWTQHFSPVFSTPAFSLWTTLITGWALSPRTRFVSDMIVSSDATRRGAWRNYYRFFSQYKWAIDELYRILMTLLLERLLPANAVVVLAVDDTLCRKRGLGMFGVGMHHDPLISSKNKKLTSWGHSWVVVAVVVHGLPWAPDRVWSLPVGFRLYVNQQGVTKGKKKNGAAPKKKDPNHRTRPELALELLKMMAAWFPERRFLVVGDSLYGGKSIVRHLPDNLELMSRAPRDAALYAPAPATSKKNPGRPRKKGERLPSIDQWADDPHSPWTTMKFDQYGLHGRMRWKHQDCLYYTTGGSRVMRVLLVEDLSGKRGRQVFFCTSTQFNVPYLLRTYAQRWSIEVTFENCKQLLGIADPANRKEVAVRRTAPMAGVLYSLIVLWFDETGHRHVQFPDRPWYTHKRTPSFGDMLTTLRRLSWEEKVEAAEKAGSAKKVFSQLTYFLSLAG